jgi:quercetin dioxygenase-like cupin family protein
MAASEFEPGAPVDWQRFPASDPYPGVSARRADTAHATVVRYELAPGAQYPLHSHPEEQLVHVLAGRVAFRLGDGEVELEQGDLVYLPGDLAHGARGAGPETATFLNIVVPRRPG